MVTENPTTDAQRRYARESYHILAEVDNLDQDGEHLNLDKRKRIWTVYRDYDNAKSSKGKYAAKLLKKIMHNIDLWTKEELRYIQRHKRYQRHWWAPYVWGKDGRVYAEYEWLSGDNSAAFHDVTGQTRLGRGCLVSGREQRASSQGYKTFAEFHAMYDENVGRFSGLEEDTSDEDIVTKVLASVPDEDQQPHAPQDGGLFFIKHEVCDNPVVKSEPSSGAAEVETDNEVQDGCPSQWSDAMKRREERVQSAPDIAPHQQSASLLPDHQIEGHPPMPALANIRPTRSSAPSYHENNVVPMSQDFVHYADTCARDVFVRSLSGETSHHCHSAEHTGPTGNASRWATVVAPPLQQERPSVIEVQTAGVPSSNTCPLPHSRAEFGRTEPDIRAPRLQHLQVTEDMIQEYPMWSVPLWWLHTIIPNLEDPADVPQEVLDNVKQKWGKALDLLKDVSGSLLHWRWPSTAIVVRTDREEHGERLKSNSGPSGRRSRIADAESKRGRRKHQPASITDSGSDSSEESEDEAPRPKKRRNRSRARTRRQPSSAVNVSHSQTTSETPSSRISTDRGAHVPFVQTEAYKNFKKRKVAEVEQQSSDEQQVEIKLHQKKCKGLEERKREQERQEAEKDKKKTGVEKQKNRRA
ncbi:hypothetical protein MBLNU459_g8219t1 [Dothideomycetes sp. NU459]